MGCRWWSVVIFSFPEVFCFGELERSSHSLGKAYQVPLVGTFTSSGHQGGISTWPACHLTHSWGSSKGGSGIAEQLGSSHLLPGDSVPDRSSCRYGSKVGGSPKSPPADWDQSTVSSELPDSKKESSPSISSIRSTISVVSSKSLDGEGESSFSTHQDQSADLKVVSRLESKLVFLKVTCCLGLTGLEESVCFLGHTWLGESLCPLDCTGLGSLSA